MWVSRVKGNTYDMKAAFYDSMSSAVGVKCGIVFSDILILILDCQFYLVSSSRGFVSTDAIMANANATAHNIIFCINTQSRVKVTSFYKITGFLVSKMSTINQ